MATEQPTPILDNPTGMHSMDKRNMLRLINELPEQCETALGIGRNFVVEPLAAKPSVVYITGIGDSGIAGDMAAAVISEELDVPIVSDHGGQIPKYVGEDALVLVVDYSGKSQSTLQNYMEAVQRGSSVVCITSGGKLLETASKDGTKIIKIPPGQPTRSAIGYLFVPLVSVIEKYELASGLTDKISNAIKLLKNAREALRFDNPTARNIAKQISLALADKLVVVYGTPDYRQAVANRWKSQINANSKMAAFAGTFPDAAESEISGWERAENQCKEVALVYLKDPLDKTEISSLMSISIEILSKFSISEINLKGNTTIEKLFYGIFLGDYVSCYLAFIREVDPTPTEYLSYMELRLAGETPEA